MMREPLLGQLHRDLACAVALGLVELNLVVANAEAITLHDGVMRPVGTVAGWLNGDDPLDVATREYLIAKREASQAGISRSSQSGWGFSAAAKTRSLANEKANKARVRARQILAERGVLAHARQLGLPIKEIG